jgi:hypothetical protein
LQREDGRRKREAQRGAVFVQRSNTTTGAARSALFACLTSLQAMTTRSVSVFIGAA